MSRAPGKTTRFIRKRVVFLVREGAQRAVSHVDAVGISALLGPGRRILQVIPAVVLVHPGTLHERIEEGVVVVFAEALPAVDIPVSMYQFNPLAHRLKRPAVYLLAVGRIEIARSVIEVDSSVVIEKKSRVPRPDGGCGDAPRPALPAGVRR